MIFIAVPVSKRKESTLEAHTKAIELARYSIKACHTEEQIEQSFEGWKAHAEKGNNYNTIKSMEQFYRKTMMG